MSNFTKDQPSIRVFAPPGGRSTNIFGVPEPEAPVSHKKNHMESDIFGCKKDYTDSAPAKQTRNVTNNIFGTDPEPQAPKSSVYSEKNRSTIFDEAPPIQASVRHDRQRSNIFNTPEPVQQSASNRPISEKYKSNIFSSGDDDTQSKRQPGTRQGLRDPNASRMGYNPINGEPYSTKDGLNSKVEQVVETTDNGNETVQTAEEENGHDKQEENGKVETPTENGNSQSSVDKHANGTNGHSTGKNSHTNVRVVHPPGGRSNGPLW